MFVLIVAVYTALGGQFDRPPHRVAIFADLQTCQLEADTIEETKSHPELGVQFVAICAPAELNK